MKKLLCMILSILLIVSLVGCAGKSSGDTPGSSDSNVSDTKSNDSNDSASVRIAYVTKSLADDFMINLRDAMVKYAKDYGYSLDWYCAEGNQNDIEGQVKIMDDVILKEYDYIILLMADSVALIPSIISANNADIPVILVNDDINKEEAEAQGAEYVCYIGVDNYTGGYMAGEYALENYDSAKTGILGGIEGVKAGDDRLTGFKDAVALNSGFEIVSELRTDWSRDQGYSSCQDMMEANPDLQLIFSASSAIALGAVEAIQQAGKSDQIKVIGFDGTADDIASIQAGELFACASQDCNQYADTAMTVIKSLINGETVEKEIYTDCFLLSSDNISQYA